MLHCPPDEKVFSNIQSEPPQQQFLAIPLFIQSGTEEENLALQSFLGMFQDFLNGKLLSFTTVPNAKMLSNTFHSALHYEIKPNKDNYEY